MCLTSVCASCDFFLLPLYLQIVYLLHPTLVCFYSILLLLFLDIWFYSKERKKGKDVDLSGRGAWEDLEGAEGEKSEAENIV